MTDQDIKQCPFCAEDIKANAIVCKHCGRDLTTPVPTSQEKPKKKRGGCLRTGLIIIGVLFGLAVVVAIITPSSDEESAESASAVVQNSSESGEGNAESLDPALIPTATPEPTATSEPTATPLPVIGQDVVVDEIRWKILEATNLGSTLEGDDLFIDDLTSSGQFIRLRFEIENLSTDMLTFAGLGLIDEQGREYTRSSDAIFFIDQSEFCLIENINPNITKTCTEIFEVPPDATGLKAKAGDLKILGTAQAEIDLALGD